MTKNGPQPLYLDGDNTYTGPTTILQGAIAASSDTALGATGTGNETTVQDGATLWIAPGHTIAEPLIVEGTGVSNGGALQLLNGTSTLTGAVHLDADTSVDIVNGAELRVTGAITGEVGAALFKKGLGMLTLSNPASSLEFAAVDAGVLRLGAAGALPDAMALSVSGTLDLNGFDETTNSIFGSGVLALGGNTLTVIQTMTATFDGVITGTGGLTKAGGDRLTLGGTTSNTFTGTTTVTAGELRLAKTSGHRRLSVRWSSTAARHGGFRRPDRRQRARHRERAWPADDGGRREFVGRHRLARGRRHGHADGSHALGRLQQPVHGLQRHDRRHFGVSRQVRPRSN